MSVSEHQLNRARGATIFSNEFQDVKRRDAEIFHEGGHIRIRITRRLDERAVSIPLRNGFPLYASDRTAQCFTVLDSCGRRAASAIRVRDFGLHVMFDSPPMDGDFFIHTQTPVGRA